eukprot:TRINITY_DN64939_c0_g1_i1.p1 TRINITY_DN64939_c0_g1~~TRINITY_DN64939_c0_g1_i1.p1  ORF type:complete len:276 (+),score=40.73 TRINITY_DN64939_c0_g1_i1:92-919(+)
MEGAPALALLPIHTRHPARTLAVQSENENEVSDSVWGDGLEGFLKRSKVAMFECLQTSAGCDLRFVVGPENARPIDGACAVIAAAYDDLLGLRENGRDTVVSLPVLNLRRDDFGRTRLEEWLSRRGFTDQELLFLDDVEEILKFSTPVGHNSSGVNEDTKSVSTGEKRLERGTVASAPRPRDEFDALLPGAYGLFSAAVAGRLLTRAASVAPAGRGKLFATGIAAEDPLYLGILGLLRDAVIEETGNFDPRLQGRNWSVADSDMAKAILVILQSQ